MELAVRDRGRVGVTLIELLIVLGILAVMYTLAASNLQDLIGRYRLNGAARELADEIESCRVRAITENREYAVQLALFDPTPDDGDWRDNRGRYEIRAGNAFVSSAEWETVVDGVHDLHDGPGDWRGVSIEPWTALAGPPGYGTADAIVLSPKGYVINPPTDFSDGVIRIVLRNKAAPITEQRVVRVDRGGGTRIAMVD